MTESSDAIDALWPDGAFTPIERAVLGYLLQAAGQPVSKEELLREVWGYSPKTQTRTLESTVHRLRLKVEPDPSRPSALRNLRGLGYILVPPGPAPQRPSRDEIARKLTEWLGEDHDWILYTGSEGASTNLTPDATRFVGRQDDLAALGRLLDSGTRMITLHGPGGSGKTRLARELARARADDYQGGAWFCDLSDATSPADALAVVTDVLGLVRSPGNDGVLLSVAAVLKRRGPTLIVADNVEQILAPVAQAVATVLGLVPTLTVVATSREPLGIGPEHLHAVDPLPTEDAVALLRSRIEQARSYDTDPGDEAILSTIADLLDGMPLALEMAAARARILPLAELASRLESQFELLRLPSADGPDRQRTLEKSIEWSWRLLSQDERAALIQLAVFRGGCALEVAEQVIQTQGDTLLVLGSLMDKSMLRRHRGRHRMALYESVRAYALAHHDGLLEAAQARHADWATNLATETLERLDNDPAAGVSLVREVDNLAEAQRWLATQRDRRAIPVLRALGRAYWKAGTPVDLVQRVRRARDQLRPAGDDAAWIHGVLGSALVMDHDLEAATAELDRGLERASAKGLLRAFVLYYQAVVARWRGQTDRARALATEGAKIARACGDVALQIRLDHEVLAAEDPDMERQQAFYLDAIERAQRHAPALLGGLWDNLAAGYSQAGQLEDALGALAHAREACRAFDDEGGAVRVETNLAQALGRLGRLDEADALFTQSLALLDRLGGRISPGITRLNAAITARRLGALDRADRLLADAAAELGADSPLLRQVRAYQVISAAARGDLQRAESFLADTQGLERQSPTVHQLTLGYLDLARIREGVRDGATLRASLAERLERLEGPDAWDSRFEVSRLREGFDGLTPT